LANQLEHLIRKPYRGDELAAKRRSVLAAESPVAGSA